MQRPANDCSFPEGRQLSQWSRAAGVNWQGLLLVTVDRGRKPVLSSHWGREGDTRPEG